ncbi:uncharacterized protein LOC142229597 [Haematobia irritans]|uniref:uncharacterized protein LOC142229597 n=1 Tax=Haematobia irritans TaxID=7368 RepID=UPI003F507171
MMETFLVLGLCFILYEALDFFQGCIHSATPNTSDQIDAYRRQLDEQRQKQQEEQFLANLTPLLSAQLAAAGFNFSTASSPTASTASVISDLRAQVQREIENHSVSTPALHGVDENRGSGVVGGFRPANIAVYENQELHATSSLPRDYYYLQQQQLKNKNSSKSILSKFSSSSDNRIFPESASILGNPAGVITTQPLLQQQRNSFDCPTPIITQQPPATGCILAQDLKRALIQNNNNNDTDEENQKILSRHNSQISLTSTHQASSSDEDEEEVSDSSSSQGEASLQSCPYTSDHDDINEDRTFTVGSCSSSHADFREIECERLRRQCVSVKRIYSISEKF